MDDVNAVIDALIQKGLTRPSLFGLLCGLVCGLVGSLLGVGRSIYVSAQEISDGGCAGNALPPNL